MSTTDVLFITVVVYSAIDYKNLQLVIHTIQHHILPSVPYVSRMNIAEEMQEFAQKEREDNFSSVFNDAILTPVLLHQDEHMVWQHELQKGSVAGPIAWQSQIHGCCGYLIIIEPVYDNLPESGEFDSYEGLEYTGNCTIGILQYVDDESYDWGDRYVMEPITEETGIPEKEAGVLFPYYLERLTNKFNL